MPCRVEDKLMYAAGELARRGFAFTQSNVAMVEGVSQAAVSAWIARGNNIDLWNAAEKEYRIKKYMLLLKREKDG